MVVISAITIGIDSLHPIGRVAVSIPSSCTRWVRPTVTVSIWASKGVTPRLTTVRAIIDSIGESITIDITTAMVTIGAVTNDCWAFIYARRIGVLTISITIRIGPLATKFGQIIHHIWNEITIGVSQSMKKRDSTVGGREQDVPGAVRIKGCSGSRIGLPRHGTEFNGLTALKCVDCERARRIRANHPIFL